MEQLKLEAQTRKERKRKTNALRESDKIPAVLYGHGIKNQSLTIDFIVFDKLYKKAGESTLIDLAVDGKTPSKVLIQDIQYNPVTGAYSHIDFYQVRMDEKITTHVSIQFIGEAPAVKQHGGILVKSKDKIEIECLPKDLIHEIKVDLSQLKNIDDTIRISQLALPKEVTILEDMEEPIISVAPPRSEEELASLNAEVKEDVTKVEVEKEKKPEEGEEAGEAPKKEEKK